MKEGTTQELLIRKENESDATSRWIITGNENARFLFQKCIFIIIHLGV